MLRAISGDATFLRVLRNRKFSGAVHSVFRNAINLLNETDGALYAIVAARYGNIPNALLVADRAIGDIDVEAGAGCHVDAGDQLFIGNHALSFAECPEWTGQLPIISANCNRFAETIAHLETLISDHGQAGGMKVAADASLFARETGRALDAAATNLVGALLARDLSAAQSHATKLIGLGPGLTPSGDDFLVGLFAVLRGTAPGPQRDLYHRLGAHVAAGAVQRTNVISATALMNASIGRVPETVITLLSELCGGEPQHLKAAAERVLAIGSSSGTDMLYGILAGVKVIAVQPKK